MIQSEKLKKFFLHQDPQIRQEAARYFYDGCILDPQILPLTIQSYRQYGTAKDVLILFYAGRQIMDDTSAQQLFELLRETDDELLEMHLTRLLTQASLDFLNLNLEQMQAYGEQKLWETASNRLELARFSPEQRWQKLIDYSKQCCNQDTNAMVSAPLVQSLVGCDIPDADQICQLLTDPSVIGQWMEIFLIELAALRKITQAVPIIIDKLQQDDFGLSDACSKALSRIGTEMTVQILKEKCITGNWGIQLSAACILGDIKLPQSELAVIDLLDNHKNNLPHDIYCHLCFSLCDLMSNKAFHYGKAILDDIQALEVDSMRQRLMTLAVIFGTPLSPQVVRQWKREIVLEPMRRREYMRKTRPELYRIGQQLRDRFTDEPEEALQNELEMDDEYVAPPAHSMAGDTPKTGRNENCPCGSGKKYKKCCGK